MAVMVLELDLQLPVQSVSIIIKVVSSQPVLGEVYSILHYVIKFVSFIDGENTELPQVTDKLYHTMFNYVVSSTSHLSRI